MTGEIQSAVFAALLAPAAGLPAVLAAKGGSLGALAAAASLPVALLVGWRLGKLPKGGLGDALHRWGVPGKALIAVYYLWTMALAATTMGACVDRLRRTDYGSWPSWALSAALTLVCIYLVSRGKDGFFRAAAVFCLTLAALLVLILALGLFQLRWEDLSPARGNAAGALTGAVPVLASFSVGVLGAFFPREDGKPRHGWVWGWCAAVAGVSALVTGVLGAAVAAHGPLPFFLALQGLGVKGGFQRLEALGTAAWALSDLTLVGLAALAAGELTKRPSLVWPVTAAAALGGCFLTNARMEPLSGWFYAANLLLGAAVPVVLSLGKGQPQEGG